MLESRPSDRKYFFMSTDGEFYISDIQFVMEQRYCGIVADDFD